MDLETLQVEALEPAVERRRRDPQRAGRLVPVAAAAPPDVRDLAPRAPRGYKHLRAPTATPGTQQPLPCP